MPKTQPKRMTTLEVASRLRVSSRTVLRMVDREQLKPALKVPGQTGAYLFEENEVARFEHDQHTEPAIPAT